MATKKRSRKSKRTQKVKSAEARNKHWLDCRDCTMESILADGDVESFLCWRCTAKTAGAPELPKPALTPEQKVERAERKAARIERKAAIARGDIVEDVKVPGFGRGWHKRILFIAERDGETLYFTRGEKITAAAYKKLEKAQVRASQAAIKPTAGWGRGWHFKDVFYGPTGDLYAKGKLAKKATKEPTEQELAALLEQHG